jgi:signal peptidase I
MSPDPVGAGPLNRTYRAGWGWLLLTTVSRVYVVLLGSLAACALLPMLTGLSGSVVQSGSMEPHLSAGDVVLSHALPAAAPAPMGRVITFKAPAGSAKGGFVLHRLVAANGNGTLVTAGDANAGVDSTPLDRHNIVSQGCLLIPWIGLPALWVTTGAYLPLGIWALLTLGALFIGVADSASRRSPVDPGRRSRDGRDPELRDPEIPGTAVKAAPHPGDSLSSIFNRIRIATGPAAVALVGLLTAAALATASFGTAAAAFSARTSTAGNTWRAAGPATKLAFTTSPSGSTGGIAFATQPVVAAQDAGGNTVSLSAAPVTLSITNPAGAVLTCTANPRTATSGAATFAGCRIDKAGTYTLTATSGVLSSDVSAAFTITAGAATKLAFTTSPSGSTGGTAFATQPVVAVQDASGNTTAGTNPVTLTITTPAGAVLTCTTNPKAAVAGVATFAGCRIDKTGTYTLTATSGTLTTNVSSSFTITVGSAAKLAFTTSPSNTAANTGFTAQPVVAVQDVGGNTVTTSSASVTLTITPPTGGATLTNCTANPKAAVAGVASFAACRLSTAGIYTLTATATGLTNGVSAGFTIFGTATKLAFTTSPSGSSGATAFATQPVVTVQDTGGNTVTTSSASVTLSITTPAGAVLSCTANPKNAVAGVDAFAGCRIDKTGTYTLTAATAGLTSAVSASLTITTGAASKLAFTTSPSGSTGGTAFPTQPVVAVQDAGGNTVTTSSASVTMSITTPAGATLTCATNPKAAVSGVATFAGCGVNKTGTYTLTAASTGLTNAVSTSFTISVGTATKLAFTTSPASTARNVVFVAQPVVAVQDAGGNTVTTSGPSVTLTITPPAGVATLFCTTNPRSTSSGLATFAGCRIDTTGSYTLTATSGILTTAVSTSFTIS